MGGGSLSRRQHVPSQAVHFPASALLQAFVEIRGSDTPCRKSVSVHFSLVLCHTSMAGTEELGFCLGEKFHVVEVSCCCFDVGLLEADS